MRIETREKVENPTVVFEDNNFLVLDKPSGWIVNSTQTSKDQPVVQDWLKNNLSYPISTSFEYRSGIVHRLDKETSGVLLVAKTPEYFNGLQDLFRERKVKKRYVALVHGRLESREGVIEVQVGRLPWNRRRFGVLAGGRDSKTSYKLIEVYKKDNDFYSLVNFFPETGRTHQIRIHARHIGHAIVGDSFYAGRKTSRKDRVWCPRVFLHAAEIAFFDPTAKKEFSFASALPSELQNALTGLTKFNDQV
jgi:23S rRNA pseudouridine1911/1915/1917 synthase